MVSGRAWKFGDNVSTDLIAPGRYFHLRSELPRLAEHTLEDARSEFASEVERGDFVVAGQNFGMGSSREHAPAIIKMCGVEAVIAESFARIFYRNCINVGLPAVEIDTSGIDDGEELEIDLGNGVVRNVTKGTVHSFRPLPPLMRRILDGGLKEHVRKHGGIEV
ncbi:MAG: Isopropylmalate/citramalate isomerase small subunit [Methanonatronarchaeales archaeon]|nr:Isopropylmalate/citramalate isomerase small subunit [Methanonatronarchaeales archaeon]